MNQSLIFNDGTVFENSHAMEMGSGLYVYFGGASMLDVLQILSDREKTSRIQYNFNSVELVFEGYTKPKLINDEGTAITGLLAKEGAE